MRHLVLALSCLLLISCQNDKPEKLDGLLGEGLLADRAVLTPKSQIYLIELTEDPLLAGLTRPAGGAIQIDEERLAAVKKEQTVFEEKLQKLSSEIKVLYRYKFILNAVSVVAPPALEKDIRKLQNVKNLQRRQIFSQPKVSLAGAAESVKKALDLTKTSVTHMETQAAYALGIRGQNLRIGVLDTGIDYVHSMFSGSGKKEDYEAVNPDIANSAFPNKKVVAGIDLVGSRFDSASLDGDRRIPKPDVNPIDEEGHGTHVAGTIAGLGDGVNTYDGVAPEALLYAIKVFGSGSTSDEVVIAGLEWAVDPNLDGDLSDQLDVVNMSLGGGFGTPYELYNKAVGNLSKAGTMVVASAGNSSDVAFIVGSPSTSDEALSVAASIDSSEHNWKFKTVGFLKNNEEIGLAEAQEGQTSKPIAEAGDVRGDLILGGLADKDYSEEEAALMKGRVALIDRGVVTFQEKLNRAQKAGAVGVIVAQNRNEPPFTMGGDKKLEIPAIMITQELSNQLKEAMKDGSAVTVVFQNPKMIEKPELINQITSFSSRGPRSSDLLIKPEITGPGQNIISAAMGEGAAGVKLSGTSMSGPHLAGVMALLKQKFPQSTSQELKSIVMSTSFSVKDKKGQPESVARQGAGQVLVSKALKAQFVTNPVSLSFGLQAIDKQKRVVKNLKLKSLFDDSIKLKVTLETTSTSVQLENSEVTLEPKGLLDLKLNFQLLASGMAGLEEEATGWVVLTNGEHQQRVPFLVRLQKVSNIKLAKVDWGAASELELEGSSSKFEFTNRSQHAGEMWLFNFLGSDSRKPSSPNEFTSRDCDLQAVGYRLQANKLEIAVKLHNRVTAWSLCEISVLMDADQDKKPEVELAMTVQERIAGLTGNAVVSTLLDFPAARKLREEAEKKSVTSEDKVELDLKPAILGQLPAKAENLQSMVILSVDLALLKTRVGLDPRIQVVASSQDAKNTESDDYLKSEASWHGFTLDSQSQAWLGLTDVTLQGGQSRILELEKAASPKPLMVLMPQNALDSRGLNDHQMEIIRPQLGTAPAASL